MSRESLSDALPHSEEAERSVLGAVLLDNAGSEADEAWVELLARIHRHGEAHPCSLYLRLLAEGLIRRLVGGLQLERAIAVVDGTVSRLDAGDPAALSLACSAAEYARAARHHGMTGEEPIELVIGGADPDRIRLPRRGFAASIEEAMPPGK